MRSAYSFSVLRYVHDPATQEFVNVGVAVYSEAQRFLRAVCTRHSSRVSGMFCRVDRGRILQLTQYVQAEINRQGRSLSWELPFSDLPSLDRLLAQVLPPDDSALQFAPAGSGVSSNLEATLTELYERYVAQYEVDRGRPRRDDDDVWKTFRVPLEKRKVAARLHPKKIESPDYEYEFDRAWKNGIWHVYEPVSFDLSDAKGILDKACRLSGRAYNLQGSREPFKIHLLVGVPQDESLLPAFSRAEKILRKMPGEKDLVFESQADAFAEEVEREVLADEGSSLSVE